MAIPGSKDYCLHVFCISTGVYVTTYKGRRAKLDPAIFVLWCPVSLSRRESGISPGWSVVDVLSRPLNSDVTLGVCLATLFLSHLNKGEDGNR